ncbi:PfkB family carbohydrate kinase [Halococcus sp. AFM35]|uniref:PfkB family carbohydrate kinase n=1 Tax=Halococcus sp. AFM35 TaxID=3421653 RepID=UPI003EBBB8AC
MTKFLAVGAAGLELAPEGDERLETATRLDVAVTGPESNAVVAASRLGIDTTWLSKLPDSALGRRVTGALRRHCVEPAVCWGGEGVGLTFAERAAAPRESTRIDDRAGAAAASLTPDELPTEDVRGAELLYTSGATLALSETLAETTAELFAAFDGPRALAFERSRAVESSAARERIGSLLSTTDVLFTTEAGAAVLDEHGTPPETAHALAATHGLDVVVVVREDGGALVWYERTVHEQHSPETDTIDERGAFDALCGAFLARRLDGEDVDEALVAGVACGALARTVRGAMPVIAPAEVDDCMAAMDGGSGHP